MGRSKSTPHQYHVPSSSWCSETVTTTNTTDEQQQQPQHDNNETFLDRLERKYVVVSRRKKKRGRRCCSPQEQTKQKRVSLSSSCSPPLAFTTGAVVVTAATTKASSSPMAVTAVTVTATATAVTTDMTTLTPLPEVTICREKQQQPKIVVHMRQHIPNSIRSSNSIRSHRSHPLLLRTVTLPYQLELRQVDTTATATVTAATTTTTTPIQEQDCAAVVAVADPPYDATTTDAAAVAAAYTYDDTYRYTLQTPLAIRTVLSLLFVQQRRPSDKDTTQQRVYAAVQQGRGEGVAVQLSHTRSSVAADDDASSRGGYCCYCSIVLLPSSSTTTLPQQQPSLLPLLRAMLQWPSRGGSTTTTTITARHVYRLVDNVQLLRFRRQPQVTITNTTTPPQQQQQRNSSSSSIPHLVPTLWPYQHAAVQWMLQREQQQPTSTNTSDNLWQCPWVCIETGTPLFDGWDEKQEDSSFTTTPPVAYGHVVTGQVVASRAAAAASQDSTGCVRGGILGEAMGLGKTVEVLACILAHPWVPVSSSSSSDVDDDTDAVQEEAVDAAVVVGTVDDMHEFFGDADDDDDDDSAESINDDGDDASVRTTPQQQRRRSAAAAVVAVVTPERSHRPTPEQWLDDTVIGACICGTLIRFDDTDTTSTTTSVVTCRRCNEPMHAACAFLQDPSVMEKLQPLQYRQHCTNRRVTSRYCEDCPCCAVKAAPQPCGTTLIVTPRAILSQWQREIERHTKRDDGKPLDVVVYNGVKYHSGRSGESQYLHPRRLAQADIVLMTFDALQSDLSHANNPFADSSSSSSSTGMQLRGRKKYRIVPTPLLGLQWWRVCLDEAQRVESTTVHAAQMALQLHAVNKWCVSGTPVGRGKLEDLHGLLLFLGVEPFSNKTWFKQCLDPTLPGVDRRIQFLLKDIFWRSTRANQDVRDQMGVPEQEEKKIVLKFSSIEKHFYERQLQATLNAAGEISAKRRMNMAKKLNILSEQLHKLRAACCHPQVGSGGIGSMKKRKKSGATSLSSRVMTMSQILDKFIDDAKLQCEEAQRLAVLHTNAMGALSKLKVEAKQQGVAINKPDRELLVQSCELYSESTTIADENAQPTLILGDAALSGSAGFVSPRNNKESASFRLDWKWDKGEKDEVWARVDFAATARKVVQLRLRGLDDVPSELRREVSESFQWDAFLAEQCELQCLDGHGEFQTVHRFEVLHDDDVQSPKWEVESGFRSNKSKSWRIVVKPRAAAERSKIRPVGACYLGVEVEFHEATIASDHLQRLHCLHNASLSFLALMQIMETENSNDVIMGYNRDDLKEKADSMANEVGKLEELYLAAAEGVHEQNRRRFDLISYRRTELEKELVCLNNAAQGSKMADLWDEGWWDDFLTLCHLHGTEEQKQSLCDTVYQSLDGFLAHGMSLHSRSSGIVPFRMFADIHGLRIAIQTRIRDIRSGLGEKAPRISDGSGFPALRGGRFRCPPAGHAGCMNKIQKLPQKPTSKEIFENSHCKVCKADWFQTGPECRHCKIGGDLEDLDPDNVTLMVLRSLHRLVKSPMGMSLLERTGSPALIDKRAIQFFEVLEAMKREKVVAWRFWRVHLDLLNDIDELHQCKNSMRLTAEGEDVTKLTAAELNAVVVPIDICARFSDHAAKQAMALGTLKRGKGTLQYLKNLRRLEQQHVNNVDGNTKHSETCMICLSPFHTNRAVLRCGHSVHADECLKKLCSGRSGTIACPLRCRIPTAVDDVMIATTQSHADGSTTRRNVKGSFGTKVTSLVSDILDVSKKGDKSLVFSQWEDMLDICGQALNDNGVSFVRASSARNIGSCVQQFRRSDVFVMLLNVKSGAEGLTLLEATHVFMLEPLLNPGLDSQAISRVHRVGQKRKTTVWRYLIEDTVEMKIDSYRMDHQDEDYQLEDSVVQGKSCAIQAGGIDGGFQTEEELLDMLKPPS